MERSTTAVLFGLGIFGATVVITSATDHRMRLWWGDRLRWQDRALCDGCPPIRTSMTAAETQCLQQLAAGNRCVEMGAAYGYSTVAMAMVAQSVVSIDPHIDLGSEQRLRANVAAYGVADKVTVLATFSQDACLILGQDSADFVFVDGDHSYGATLHDIGCAAGILVAGGTCAVDDYRRIADVTHAVDDAVSNGGWTLTGTCDELAILTRQP